MEILRFEQRFEVVVGVSLVHVRRKGMRHRQCRGPKAERMCRGRGLRDRKERGRKLGQW